MDSKIIVRILIVGLTTVLTLIVFTKKDFLKETLSNTDNSAKAIIVN